MLNDLFKLEQNGTTMRRKLTAGAIIINILAEASAAGRLSRATKCESVSD